VYDDLEELRSRWRKNAISRMNRPGISCWGGYVPVAAAYGATTTENFSGTVI